MNSFELRPHACGFFSSVEEQNRVLTNYIGEGIRRGDRVIYTVPPSSSDVLETRLVAAGVDVAQGRETGCFIIQDWNVSHCPGGHFEPKRTANFFMNQAHRSLELGFPHVRFASHMEWALGQIGIQERLLEYEARANEVWQQNPKIGVQVLCCYDASRFDSAFLVNVMRTHPFTFVDGMLIENPYYTPPALFLEELRAQRTGEHARGLAPWQLRRVKAWLEATGDNSPSVTRLAEECGLSPRHFSRAFTQSTGLPPRRWLLERRVEMAKQLLLQPARPLADIALDCGFPSQSHFTRIFSARVGCSPGTWRRKYS